MDDRELLKWAAKAAGYVRLKYFDDVPYVSHGLHGEDFFAWNPFVDDGDALRLAVKLQIDLVHFTGHLRADVREMPDVHQMHEGDPYDATRRAIVRAAAEIGKAMP